MIRRKNPYPKTNLIVNSKMKRIALLLLLIAGTLCGTRAQETPERSAETEELLEILHSIYGKKILSGTTANVNWNFNEAKWVYQHTGKWPALNCMDYIHHPWSSSGGWVDYTNVSEVVNWHKKGGLILIMWHWNVPANTNGQYAFYYGTDADQTQFDVRKIFEPTSSEYKQMIRDIDKVASYLKLLKNRKIPVLWRPLHEAGGMWFWWGRDPAACNELWRVMYDRLVNHHKLNNLIWVWTQAAAWNKPYSDGYRWYPGDDYVDIVSIDVYNNSSSSNIASTCFKFLKTSSPKKFVALTECGNVANISKQWRSGAKWLFFAPWYDYGRTSNVNSDAFKSTDHGSCNAAWWQEAFSNDYVLSREDFQALRQEYVGIRSIPGATSEGVEKDDAMYDLSGRKILNRNAAKGIVIRNGKKYFIR